ncbi:MAG: HypC/HybG/HupF family hydrogenase formation chaperone [Propionibacteriaceae bacterium]|jgi:hypothetical protein|nr:HypC/HybG/HupF family hydrogenase formation chaperone [Propionibacteriaceae bacterium]
MGATIPAEADSGRADTPAWLAGGPVAAGAWASPEAESCVTCSDEGRPGTVVALPPGPWEPARVETERGLEEVDVTLVAPVVAGERLLIHAGLAIARLDPAD